MAHFAKIENNEVVQVIVADQSHVDFIGGEWVKVSYNMYGGVYHDPSTNEPAEDQTVIVGDEARERKNYPAPGWLYDGVGFYPKRPYPSWRFNHHTYLWDAPIAPPSDNMSFDDEGNFIQYTWSEEIYNLDASKGWVRLERANAD